MKIQHLSIPTDDPQGVAKVLGEIIGGEVTRFPPGGEKSWMAWSKDGSLQIECTPRGEVMVPDELRYKFRHETVSRHSEVHIGICVERPEGEVTEIVKKAGWPVRASGRAGDAFNVLEVWVEGAFLIEVMDPVQTARLEKAVTVENWKRVFGMN